MDNKEWMEQFDECSGRQLLYTLMAEVRYQTRIRDIEMIARMGIAAPRTDTMTPDDPEYWHGEWKKHQERIEWLRAKVLVKLAGPSVLTEPGDTLEIRCKDEETAKKLFKDQTLWMGGGQLKEEE